MGTPVAAVADWIAGAAIIAMVVVIALPWPARPALKVGFAALVVYVLAAAVVLAVS